MNTQNPNTPAVAAAIRARINAIETSLSTLCETMLSRTFQPDIKIAQAGKTLTNVHSSVIAIKDLLPLLTPPIPIPPPPHPSFISLTRTSGGKKFFINPTHIHCLYPTESSNGKPCTCVEFSETDLVLVDESPNEIISLINKSSTPFTVP